MAGNKPFNLDSHVGNNKPFAGKASDQGARDPGRHSAGSTSKEPGQAKHVDQSLKNVRSQGSNTRKN